MPIAVETFFLRPGAEGTLQNQIRQMVAEGILDGRLQPGERMPSSRRLSAHLGTSRITVTLAYSDLVADDYLCARGRSGYFVSANAPQPHDFSQTRVTMQDAVDWSRALGPRPSRSQPIARPDDWRSYRYPFVYGQADPLLFDHQNWRGCTIMALGQRDFHSLTDDRYQEDDPGLVQYIARHTLPRRGIVARADQILVTLGAQNALWLTAQLLLNRRRTAVIEEPSYPGLRDILHQTHCRIRPVGVTAEGLDSAGLPEKLDVLFCTPSHQSPTGATMPLSARRDLLAAASRRDFLIVEDDYEFEIRDARAPLPALKSMDAEGRVIHVGSFSKSLFPGLRLGFLVGAADFIREARALRTTVLRHPPGLIQRATAYFLQLGHYDALLHRIGDAFRARRAAMLDAIAQYGLEVDSPGEKGGSSLWMRAPAGIDTEELAMALRAESVLIEPGRPFFGTAGAPRNFYRIAFSSIAASRIPEGISRIAMSIEARAPRSTRQSY